MLGIFASGVLKASIEAGAVLGAFFVFEVFRADVPAWRLNQLELDLSKLVERSENDVEHPEANEEYCRELPAKF